MKLNDVFGLLNIKMGNTFGYQPKTFRIFVIKDDYNAFEKALNQIRNKEYPLRLESYVNEISNIDIQITRSLSNCNVSVYLSEECTWNDHMRVLEIRELGIPVFSNISTTVNPLDYQLCYTPGKEYSLIFHSIETIRLLDWVPMTLKEMDPEP